MANIVERLRNISRGDHERGCNGREYVCSCGYDLENWQTADEAVKEIKRLREAMEWMRDRDDRNGSLPEAYRQKIDAALSARAKT